MTDRQDHDGPVGGRTVLVTGASGYVGGRIIPTLLEQGWEVRAAFHDVTKADAMWWSDQVTPVAMDAGDPDAVAEAIAGCDAVVWLIHGMGGDDFAEKDRAAAEVMAGAVDAAGVRRVVYVSGVVPPVDEAELSEHIASRLEVERILSASSASVITLRAAVILGSGSTSFEIIRQVSERLPVQTVPTWMDSTVQPVAVVDLVALVASALDIESEGRAYDVGGPDAMPYDELLDRYAEIAGLTRPQVAVPFLPTDLVGVLTGLFTDVPSSTVEALVESLHHDMVCADDDFRRDLLPAGHEMLGIDESIRRSLGSTPRHADADSATPADPAGADPMGPMPQDPEWAEGGDGRSPIARGIDAVRSLAERI